jgi:hypothetical protein
MLTPEEKQAAKSARYIGNGDAWGKPRYGL